MEQPARKERLAFSLDPKRRSLSRGTRQAAVARKPTTPSGQRVKLTLTLFLRLTSPSGLPPAPSARERMSPHWWRRSCERSAGGPADEQRLAPHRLRSASVAGVAT